MVNKIQLNDIDFNAYECIKDKYNRVVNGINHGRAIYFDSINQVYYKIFHPDYCRLSNFRKAIEINFFEELAPALTGLIYDNEQIIGYITQAGPLLSANEFDYHLIPQDFFRILKDRIKKSGMFFYDLVPHNIILIDGKPSLIDLESVYDFSQYGNLSLHNAKIKPAELDKYITELKSTIPMKISLIQPSRNNLKYLKWSYNAIRKNQGNHIVEICIADDASTDGTWDWCQQILNEGDTHFKCIRNEGPARLGHTILYDRLVNEVASYDICMIYHADMYLCPEALDHIQKHIGPKKIVSLTRIEPPLHPPGPEKILLDCGIEPELFNEDKLFHHMEMEYNIVYKDKTTEGIFAPWAFMKSDFQEIGGHDPLYAPQSKEDSDIFNRFHLNNVQFIQTWEGYVYHMTCRGSRFNPTLTIPGQNSPEWEEQNIRSTRNFIRKWGHFVKHDQFLKPIVPSKYDIGFIIKNCNLELLKVLEPWCSTVYVDDNRLKYITIEQPLTTFNLYERVKPYDNEKQNAILIEIDGNTFTQQDFGLVQQLSEILDNDDQVREEKLPCDFALGNLRITIINLKTNEKELICRYL